MSADPADPTEPGSRVEDAELTDALVTHCHLSTDDIRRTVEAMGALQLPFTEVAVRLGLATREDITAIAARLRGRSVDAEAEPDENPGNGNDGADLGVIETALRRSQSTSLTVHHNVVRPGRQLILAHEPDSARSERIRALRTELMLLGDANRRGNVLALLSPGSGEGRSQLAAELGIAFGQLGRRSLLIDADLRHPHQHLLFNADNHWGLAQTLALGDMPSLYDIEGIPALVLMTTGAVPPNPLELVSHQRFAGLIAELRRQYDFIIIDTPPVSRYADALHIATVAENVLVLSRASVTPLSDMKDMLRRLAPTQSRVLGAVINRF